MPTIVVASSKGGVGKTTLAILLSSELARQGKDKGIYVSLIDADPNQHSARWASRDGCPENIKLKKGSNEETIIDDIESAVEESAFVIVDLEGTASMAVASAISRADLVIILCQGSDDDAVEAVKTFKMIGRQGKVLQREIPSVALFTRKSAAITSRTFKHYYNEIVNAGIEVFDTVLIERDPYKAVKSFGSTLHDLDPKDVGIAGTKKAIAEVHKLTEEVKIRLKQIISKGEG
tara:strand:- start:28990 stop:29691 length:702 start_codon:yes stop_codon:yes gene_type:complete